MKEITPRDRQRYMSRKLGGKGLYSTASDPRPQMIPRPQVIPKMNRKWSSTASDPQSRPQMIP